MTGQHVLGHSGRGVLRRPVGGPTVMHDQLRHLADAARRPGVVLQVIPLSAGAHQGMSGSFVLAEFGTRPARGLPGHGGECVEVGTTWRKASHSTGNGGECVEVRDNPRIVAVRDSKDPAGPALAFTSGRWRAFTRDVKNGAAKPA